MLKVRMPRLISAMLVACGASISQAQVSTCPFDDGGSDATNDGVVLTRYALGITGAPLVASTRYASLDPMQVKGNIECVGCALDMNGDGQIDTVDTTIIARHLAGFKGASLTGGLALGAGTRNTSAAVTSFLANGCAVGGAINAFVQGGNAFGVPAVLGTTDGMRLTVGVGDGDGLRIQRESDPGYGAAINVTNGAKENIVSKTCPPGAAGASCRIAADRVVGGVIAGGGSASGSSYLNKVTDSFGVVGGGRGNIAGNDDPDPNDGAFATVAGGQFNFAGGGNSTVGGGGGNSAAGPNSTVGGGTSNTANGFAGTVPGGEYNAASGDFSFAAGINAKAIHERSFVWGGALSTNTNSTGPGTFVVYAPGSINMYAGALGAGGCVLSTPSSGWACSSDRALKTNVRALDALDVLKRVLSMPVTSWSFKGAEPFTHIGPMAQDFKAAFGLGDDDKTISPMDSAGVALAAIQGLNQKLVQRDRQIEQLERANAAMQRDLAAIKRSLAR